MSYKLDNEFAQGHFTVTVVGCGGTGSFAAEGLARLLPLRADLVLIDPDRVEERNLIRQNFRRDELDRFKAEVLAQRLSYSYFRPIAYSTLPIKATELRYPGIIVGCVDNGPARRDIAQRIEGKAVHWVGGYSMSLPRELQTSPSPVNYLWWVDAGNAENYGQVIIGNYDRAVVKGEKLIAFPLPTIQRPELLQQVKAQRECPDIPQQGPTINQAMAWVVIEVVRRLIEGTCSWVQLYLDLEQGILSPVTATAEMVRKFKGRR